MGERCPGGSGLEFTTKKNVPRRVSATLASLWPFPFLSRPSEGIPVNFHAVSDKRYIMRRVAVWDSANASGGDGLWEAATAGRVGEAAVELHSKPATWSPTKKSFELDLLEVMV